MRPSTKTRETLDRRCTVWIDGGPRRTKGAFHPTGVCGISSAMIAALAILFALGVSNFALHRAVLESGHELIGHLPPAVRIAGGRLTLLVEFGVLLTAMLLAAQGWSAMVWIYGGYSALNLASAWAILSGRI